jgi:homoserine dehydrogenase
MLETSEVSSRERNTLTPPISVGMAGLGTVGTGVYKIFENHPAVQIEKIAVQDIAKSRSIPNLPTDCLLSNPMAIARDPSLKILIEVMGGSDLAKALVVEALTHKKHVVTANKELIAKHGPELFALAKVNGVRLMFEGAVAGGIPIILPLKLSLAANHILEIAGILNGTTNYILSKMTEEGCSFEQALQEAQAKGFAEADPTNDVEGLDTAYKIAILSGISYKTWIDPQAIYRQGITQITAVDIENARTLGYALKLIGLARHQEENTAGKTLLDIRVQPMLVPHGHPLASIRLENNAIWIRGHAVGDVMFYGKGAGEMPTASAVSADVLAIAQDLINGNDPIPAMELQFSEQAEILPVVETLNRYYIRLNTSDRPGVIGNLGKACGEFGVSLESVMQKGTNSDGTASIVLVTHEVLEKQIQQAITKIEQQETTHTIGCLLRVL